MSDKYTMEMRLCDNDGMVSHEQIDKRSDLTYLHRLNNLRRLTNFALGWDEQIKPVEEPFACTGDAHLAGEHIRCTSPAHFKSPDRSTDQPLVLHGEAAEYAGRILVKRDKAEYTPTYSSRGFAHWDPTPTKYGHIVRVYESSSAEGPHVWLNVEQTEESAREAHSNIEPERGVAHMTLEQAEEIHAKLGAAIEYARKVWGVGNDADSE